MTERAQNAKVSLHHATKMKPKLDAERNSADTFTTRMTHVATRQTADSAALEGAWAVSLVASGVVASGVVASGVVLLPVLALLIGLGVILLPEGTRCGPPGK